MKIYAVGGSVRDELLGLPVTDRDYVVVGATPQQMIDAGYKAVGADFPVFLHPASHEEYALARTERKTAPGYKGFHFHAAPNVTLEQDLARRDLTINAMAKDSHGHIIDPYGGRADLNHKLLRHVSDAFVEDPVRVLRVARFAARYAAMGFRIADETMALMQTIVANGEVDHLVPERVWQELARGLMESRPSTMFNTLHTCGALARIAPEIDRLYGVPQSAGSHPEIDTGVHVMMVIDFAATQDFNLPIRFAALTHDLGKGATPPQYLPRHPDHERKSVELVKQLSERLRVPVECRDLAIAAAGWHGEVHRAMELDAEHLAKLFEGTDALRRPDRFDELLDACAADHHGRLGFDDVPYPQRPYLRDALVRLQALDQGSIAAHAAPSHIADAIRNAKRAALQQFLDEQKR
jgi:tRNA nucleotidyltransferase (CCA-adding enzyme)